MPPLIINTNPASPETLLNRADAMTKVEQMCKAQIQWHQCSTVAEYRKMRIEGINGYPKPLVLESAKTITIRGRDGNEIELRIITPPVPTKGVVMHFHAGVLFD
jgi:acetyl esterase